MSAHWAADVSIQTQTEILGHISESFDEARDGFVFIDGQKRVAAINRAFMELFGLSGDDLMPGMGELDVDILQDIHSDLRFVFAGQIPDDNEGQTSCRETDAVLQSGTLVRVRRLTTSGGGTLATVAVVSNLGHSVTTPGDVTIPPGQRHIFEECPIGVLILCNKSNQSLYANGIVIGWLGEAFIKTLGDQPIRPVGDRTDDLLSVLSDPDFSASLSKHEIVAPRYDGWTKWAFLNGRKLDFEGHDARIIWIRDISIRKRQTFDLQSKVIEKTKQLEEALHRADLASLSKTQFLANMSHELRTPLNSIIGFSDLLRKELFGPIGSERYSEFVEHIHSAGSHLLDLINDILDVSRIELGEFDQRDDLFDLTKTVSQTIALLKPKLEEKQHSLETDLPGQPLGYWGDERKVRQVLLNLLTNAVKFTPDGGRLKISLSADPETGVTLRVEDSGIGIRNRDIERVLDPFEQAIDETYSRSIEGAGLGLYLSRSIARAHDGELEIESEVGVGTAVIVSLPGARIRTSNPS